jgi:hypothetical protein
VLVLPPRARARHLGRGALAEVAEVRAPDDIVQRRIDRRCRAEVHLGDERADHAGAAFGPLHAATGTQLVDADLVGDLGERRHGTCLSWLPV